jgi:hypothetical protein
LPFTFAALFQSSFALGSYLESTKIKTSRLIHALSGTAMSVPIPISILKKKIFLSARAAAAIIREELKKELTNAERKNTISKDA